MLKLRLSIYRLRPYRFLFLGVLVTSFLQAFVLTIGALDVNDALRTDVYVPLEAYEFNLIGLIAILLLRLISLFFIQSIVVLFYCRIYKAKLKKIISAAIWFFPTFLAPPFTLLYILSPLASIGVIDSFFNGTLTMEDIGEGWIFLYAALGFYNLFWLCILIKNLLFKKLRFRNTNK
jgi:hypothetical protein